MNARTFFSIMGCYAKYTGGVGDGLGIGTSLGILHQLTTYSEIYAGEDPRDWWRRWKGVKNG